jgi:hypothetical protein
MGPRRFVRRHGHCGGNLVIEPPKRYIIGSNRQHHAVSAPPNGAGRRAKHRRSTMIVLRDVSVKRTVISSVRTCRRDLFHRVADGEACRLGARRELLEALQRAVGT